ncbi:MAG: bis-aminopropyl spermidine synthase family protein [bacterium]
MKSTPIKLDQLKITEVRVIRSLLDTEDPWVAAGSARIPFPRFAEVLKRLTASDLIEDNRGRIRLTERGLSVAEKLRLRSGKQILECANKAKKSFKRLVSSRPRSIGDYDQGYMTIDSLFERLTLMALLGDLDGKRICILGDDDLASLGICLMAHPEQVTVFEIDKRLVDFIKKIACEHMLPIKCYMHDLRYPIPKRFHAKFDTFLTDPSETIHGLKMFVGRGLWLLKPKEGCVGYFGLTMIEASTTKWATFQKWLLNNYKLVITDILQHKAYYQNWEDLTEQTSCYEQEIFRLKPTKPWYNSALFRIETIDGFKPKSIGKIRGAIFQDDEACGLIGKEIK